MPPDEVGAGRPRSATPPLHDVALVAVGGSIGTLARVALSEMFPADPGVVPWATFVENVAGAFVLALVLTLVTERVVTRREVRLAVCTGALGAFTTYSALAGQTVELLTGGRMLLGGGYALGSVVAGVAAAVMGVRLGRGVAGSREVRR